MGDWRTRFFHLDVATRGPGLLEEFAVAKTFKRPQLTATEFEQVEAAFAVEDRSWRKVIRGRTICAMGKFKLTGNKEKVKAAARTIKEKDQSSSLKRKTDVSESPSNTSALCKRSKTSQDAAIGSSKLSIPTSTIVELPANTGNEIAETADATRSSSSPVRLSSFFEEIKRSFSTKSPIRPAEGSPDIEQKFHMSFHKTAAVLYAQYEMLGDLEAIRGPLKEKLLHLTQQLVKTESELEVVNRVSKRNDDTIVKLEKSKCDADTVIDALKADFDELEKKKNVEIEELYGRIKFLLEENKSLKEGEGLDFEALVDLPSFAPIRDCIEDATGDELIRRIKEVHPEWDLDFLTGGGESPGAEEQEKNEGVKPSAKEGDRTIPDSTIEGGPA